MLSFVGLGCLLGSVGAFLAPPSRHVFAVGSALSANPKAADSPTIELDNDGRLRIGHTDGGITVMDGISSSIWSATRPAGCDDGKSNSLFLHTSHPKDKSEHEASVGRLLSCRRFLACSRVTRYWMGPKWGNQADSIPLDTQFLLIEVKEGGPYVLLLPLVDDYFRASLQKGKGQNILACHEESGDKSVLSSGMNAIFVSVSDDPFKLLKNGFSQVAEEIGSFRTLDRKKLPQSVDDFGWCTWDAFYSDVSPKGVIDGVSSLRAAGIQPRNIILDDGWQQVTPVKETSRSKDKQIDGESNNTVSKGSPSVFSRIAGRILVIVTKWIEAFYEKFVKRAHHNSIPNRIWRFLTNTVLKPQMQQYFESDTDFGRQLNGFHPNPKFQDTDDGGMSLKSLVTRLKTELGVKRLYCWHALNGYWRGLSPELGAQASLNVTNMVPQPSRHLLDVEPQLAWDTVSLFGVGLLTSKPDLAKFYECLHKPLVEAGVDGVKVDVQSGVPAVGGGVGGGPHIARLYSEGLEESISDHFSVDDASSCINCMCHSTENLYRYKVTSIARASDDFYPRRPSSHSVHLVNVAYNSLFIGEICLPDWDMFHSKHESAGLHAAARAIGGCPVYVSDAPGQHDASLLKRLVLPDGSVLRAKLPGRPTRDCLFCDVGKDGASVLKIWNKNPASGVVGAFHVQGVAWNFDTHENEVVDDAPSPLTAAIKPHDVETLRDESGPFAVWSHRVSTVNVLPNGTSTLTVNLKHREWEIFTVVPIRSIKKVAWGPLGLGDMLNTGGALIEDSGLSPSEIDGSTMVTAEFSSRGPGRFVAFCRPKPTTVSIGGITAPAQVPFSYDPERGMLSFSLPSEENGPHKVKVVWD